MNEFLMNNNIRKILIDNEDWFALRDICNVLGLGDTSGVSKRLGKDEKKIVFLPTNGGMQKLSVINKIGIQRVLTTSRKHNVQKIADFLGVKVYESIFLTIEQSTLKIISSTFQHIEQKSEFWIENYRIDLYFPEFNIAIECDEFNHSNYDTEEEKRREQLITEKIGCKFIRYNPNEKKFNIGDVINRIMMELNCVNTNDTIK